MSKGTKVVYYEGGEYLTDRIDYDNTSLFKHSAWGSTSTPAVFGVPLYVGYTSTVGYGCLTNLQLSTSYWLPGILNSGGVGTPLAHTAFSASGNCFLIDKWGSTASGIVQFRIRPGKVGLYMYRS